MVGTQGKDTGTRGPVPFDNHWMVFSHLLTLIPLLVLMLLLPPVLLGACGESAPRPDTGYTPNTLPPPESTQLEELLPPPPWHQPPLAASAVPPVYLTEWRRAENRASCAPLAPASLGVEQARARAATFSGGWAVAYDLPELRSAFGVAGAGVEAEAEELTYVEWPHGREWSDGSSVGYGPEGGSGPNQLAYLQVAGQGCLYNVWSRLGVEHLEQLLEELRFVAVEAR